MIKRDGSSTSIWQSIDSYKGSSHGSGRSFDVIIAGGGITGITTGLLLQQAGKSVLIAEASNLAFGTTSGTTAHLNTLLDTPYFQVEKDFGEEEAKQLARAIKDAHLFIERNVQAFSIDCDYRKADGILYAKNEDQVALLDKIYQSAKKVEVDVSPVTEMPYSISSPRAIRFGEQATFHPVKYIRGLAAAFEKAGGTILENCRVVSHKEEEGITIETNRGAFTCTDLIYATHIPSGVNQLHFRNMAYRSYALAVTLKNKDAFSDKLLYDLDEPYHYFRAHTEGGQTYLIGGGEDHKTGADLDTTTCFDKLEAYMRSLFDVDEVAYKWSSQYFESADGLPYIGLLPGQGDHTWVATGYGGNGMVYSAVAANLLKDLILQKENELSELFDPSRIKMVAGFSNILKEAADVTGELIRKLIPAEKLKDLDDLGINEGKVVRYAGEKVAISRNEAGQFHILHAACTHIKCDVNWNKAEQTWDCPCHGSRFFADGKMVTGPARKDLGPFPIYEEKPATRK